ncbi:hypothetical protein E2C01_061873 [Portunus trituberculatus]|uniref:Uncharacterized protein n=1 Tax=Portunus trituberculatus TaxID=210409 RepID=A0A5B7H9H4_PORTR|nr:hypothetical protein [Portunus trituberculatus]
MATIRTIISTSKPRKQVIFNPRRLGSFKAEYPEDSSITAREALEAHTGTQRHSFSGEPLASPPTSHSIPQGNGYRVMEETDRSATRCWWDSGGSFAASPPPEERGGRANWVLRGRHLSHAIFQPRARSVVMSQSVRGSQAVFGAISQVHKSQGEYDRISTEL